MDISPLDIIYHLINIIVLYVLLRVLLYKPVLKFMNNRTAGVQAQLAQAEEKNRKAEELQQEYTAHLAAAKDEAAEQVRAEMATATDAAQKLIDDAKTSAGNIIATAKADAQQARKDEFDAFKQQITDLSLELAENILQREVNESDNRKVIESFFERVG